MAKGGDAKTAERIYTTLGKETSFTGTMRFDTSLKIDGRFEGKIESPGFLYLEKGSDVKADINVRSIVIGGVVHGNIVATEKLEMLSTGQIFGNVRSSKLKIADGVVFEGKCEMIKQAEDVDIFSSSVGKIKSTVDAV